MEWNKFIVKRKVVRRWSPTNASSAGGTESRGGEKKEDIYSNHVNSRYCAARGDRRKTEQRPEDISVCDTHTHTHTYVWAPYNKRHRNLSITIRHGPKTFVRNYYTQPWPAAAGPFRGNGRPRDRNRIRIRAQWDRHFCPSWTSKGTADVYRTSGVRARGPRKYIIAWAADTTISSINWRSSYVELRFYCVVGADTPKTDSAIIIITIIATLIRILPFVVEQEVSSPPGVYKSSFFFYAIYDIATDAPLPAMATTIAKIFNYDR